jgi:hypothetical protein
MNQLNQADSPTGSRGQCAEYNRYADTEDWSTRSCHATRASRHVTNIAEDSSNALLLFDDNKTLYQALSAHQTKIETAAAPGKPVVCTPN